MTDRMRLDEVGSRVRGIFYRPSKEGRLTDCSHSALELPSQTRLEVRLQRRREIKGRRGRKLKQLIDGLKEKRKCF